MPFKSKSQIRKFYALKNEGKMDQSTIDEWMSETPSSLPERMTKKAFWIGFFKQADGADGGMGDGGSGFTGTGKGNIAGSLEWDMYEGDKNKWDGKPGGENMTDKTLLDRERNPSDFHPFQTGPAMEDENGSHVIY